MEQHDQERLQSQMIRNESEINDEIRYTQGYLAGLRFALGKNRAEIIEQENQKTTDPLLVQTWRQMNDEMHHGDTMVMQATVCIFLFLSAFAAIMHYKSELGLAMWILGFIAICWIGASTWAIGRSKMKCYWAAVELQSRFTLPKDLDEKLKPTMTVRKPKLTDPRAYIPLLLALSVFWIYVGLVEIFKLACLT